jgi:hypothetical protein
MTGVKLDVEARLVLNELVEGRELKAELEKTAEKLQTVFKQKGKIKYGDFEIGDIIKALKEVRKVQAKIVNDGIKEDEKLKNSALDREVKEHLRREKQKLNDALQLHRDHIKKIEQIENDERKQRAKDLDAVSKGNFKKLGIDTIETGGKKPTMEVDDMLSKSKGSGDMFGGMKNSLAQGMESLGETIGVSATAVAAALAVVAIVGGSRSQSNHRWDKTIEDSCSRSGCV